MKLMSGIAVCICSVMLGVAGTPESTQPGAFTLAVSGRSAPATHQAPMSFRLAPGIAGLTAGRSINPVYAYEGDTNTFYGQYCGNSTMTGASNSFFGAWAGYNNTEGNGNSFFGRAAGISNTTGSWNSFFGEMAGFSNTEGEQNTFVGVKAGLHNIAGFGNSFVGSMAGASNTEGDANSFVGLWAGFYNTTGSENSFFGASAGAINTEGSRNTFVGDQAGSLNTTADGNSFVGWAAGLGNLTGHDNTFVGQSAGRYNRTGSYNLFLGAIGEWGSDDSNTIRIGNPYDASANPPAGQNRTFIAGIFESPLTASDGPSVIGIASEGRLGTFPSELLPKGPQGDPGPQGPQGPNGPQGPKGDTGAGLIPGSLLFLATDVAPPAGYTFVGYTDLVVASTGGNRRSTYRVNIYRMN